MIGPYYIKINVYIVDCLNKVKTLLFTVHKEYLRDYTSLNVIDILYSS